MSPSAGKILVEEIIPRIRVSVLAGSAIIVGADDHDELIQDATATAAKLLHSVEARGKTVTPGNVAYFAVRLTGQGRRSTGQSKTDVMHPGTQINSRTTLVSLDAPLTSEGDGEEIMCLHETLACGAEDPSTAAARRLDWAPVVASLDPNGREVLTCLVIGEDLTCLVPRLGRSRSALQKDKERLAGLVREHFGPDILVLVQQQPKWRDNIDASRERMACRYERQPG
jgi:hypothetical protein